MERQAFKRLMFAHTKGRNVPGVKASLDDVFECAGIVRPRAILSTQGHDRLCERLHPHHQLAGFLISFAHQCQSRDRCHPPL